MKVLTVRQPWASLISLGVKRIETRSWSTSFRGPLAIHAGKARPECSQWEDGPFDDITDRFQYGAGSTWHSGSGRCVVDDDSWWLQEIATDTVHDMPLGAVVAVCDLIDVVPIRSCAMDYAHVCHSGTGLLLHSDIARPWADGETEHVVDDQLPFGDFTTGRFAWLLDNVRPLDHPVPMKGAQGLRDLPPDIAAAITRALTEGATRCLT